MRPLEFFLLLANVLAFLVWARRRVAPRSGRPTTPQPTRRQVRGWPISLSSVGVGVTSWLPVAFSVFHFPVPGGSCGIGTVTYHWIDAQRQNIFSPDARALIRPRRARAVAARPGCLAVQ